MNSSIVKKQASLQPAFFIYFMSLKCATQPLLLNEPLLVTKNYFMC